jgi:shikimate 5-dehydrogenase
MEMKVSLTPALAPTMHFIGVSTAQSSIMKVFPAWATELGIPEATLNGIDLPLNAPAELYRDVVSFIRRDPLSQGALVTTHKLAIYQSAQPLFDELDQFATAMQEVSSISKQAGRFIGQARDPISAGRTLQMMVPPDFWKNDGGDVFCIGSGGAGVAIVWFLLHGVHPLGRPRRVVVSDPSEDRLRHLRQVVRSASLETCRIVSEDTNDRLLQTLGPRSLIINASGMGKDRPGSPIQPDTLLPFESSVWELNYRGERAFLGQAEEQAEARQLRVYDGWDYFLHGWTTVIADVFHLVRPVEAESFQRLSSLAAAASGRK